MTREDFRQHIAGTYHKQKRCEYNLLASVTDPTFARTGRQIATEMPTFEYKDIYRAGVSSEHMQPFDKMYVDKISGFESAKQMSDKTKQELRHAKETFENGKDD